MKICKNILILVGIGIGKILFLCFCLDVIVKESFEMCLFIIEDIDEMILSFFNRSKFFFNEYVLMDRFLEVLFCFVLDWIVVGEVCIGVVLLMMFKVWNSGYSGGFLIIYFDIVEFMMLWIKVFL